MGLFPGDGMGGSGGWGLGHSGWGYPVLWAHSLCVCELSLLPGRTVSVTLGSGRFREQYNSPYFCCCCLFGGGGVRAWGCLCLFIQRWRRLKGVDEGDPDDINKYHALLEAPDLCCLCLLKTFCPCLTFCLVTALLLQCS